MFYAIEWVVKKIYYKASDLRDYPQKNSFIACSDIVTSPFLTTPPLSPSIVHGSSYAVSNLMCFVWTNVMYSLEISCARTALSIFALSMWFPGFFISVSSIPKQWSPRWRKILFEILKLQNYNHRAKRLLPGKMTEPTASRQRHLRQT